MNPFGRIFGSDEGLPDPSNLSEDDIEYLNRGYMSANGIGPTQKDTNDDGAVLQSGTVDATLFRSREAVDNSTGSGSEGPGDMARIRAEVL